MDAESVYVKATLRHSSHHGADNHADHNHGHSHGDTAHKHNDDCGHIAVRHGDHFDFLVDGALHHYDEGEDRCDVHGELDISDLQALLRSTNEGDTQFRPSAWAANFEDDEAEGGSLRRRNARFVRVARQLAGLPMPDSSVSPVPGTPVGSTSASAGQATGSHTELASPSSPSGRSTGVTSWARRLCSDRDSARFLTMLLLTGSFMCVELGVGITIHSLVLQADAFHMLSDLVALVIGYLALTSSKRAHSSTASFGYARFEVVGSLVNAVFLLATALQITIEAVQRLVESLAPSMAAAAADTAAAEGSEGGAPLLMIVGAVGLGINLAGILVFASGHGHGHSHGLSGGGGGGHGHGHGAKQKKKSSHSHGGHGHSHSATAVTITPGAAPSGPLVEISSPMTGGAGAGAGRAIMATGTPSAGGGLASPGTSSLPEPTPLASPTPSSDGHGHSHDGDDHHDEDEHHGHSHEGGHGHSHGPAPSPSPSPSSGMGHHGHSHMNMNVQGVLLHVMGDALGSVAVLLSGAVMQYTTWPHRDLADPLASLIIVIIICMGTIPLLKQSSDILLEKVPGHVDLPALRKALLAVPGILSLHDLHVWAVNPQRTVGTVHVILDRRVGAQAVSGSVPGADAYPLVTPLVPNPPPMITTTRSMPIPYRRVVDSVKLILHQYGVHASTVQPEWVSKAVQHRLETAAAEVLAGRSKGLEGSLQGLADGHGHGENGHSHDDGHGHSHSHGRIPRVLSGTTVSPSAGGGLGLGSASGHASHATTRENSPGSEGRYGSPGHEQGTLQVIIGPAGAVPAISAPGASTAPGVSAPSPRDLLSLDLCNEIVCGEACVEASCCPQPHPHHASAEAVGATPPRRRKR